MYPSTVQKRLDRINDLHRLVEERDQGVFRDETSIFNTMSEIRRIQSELLSFSTATVERSGSIFLNDDIAEKLKTLRAKIDDVIGVPKEKKPEVKFPGNKDLAEKFYLIATKYTNAIGAAELLKRHISTASIDLAKVLPRARKLKKYKIPGVSEYTLLVLQTLLIDGPDEAEEVYKRRPFNISAASDTSLGAKQKYQGKAKTFHLEKNDLKVDEKRI
jgi:hypothetical protein